MFGVGSKCCGCPPPTTVWDVTRVALAEMSKLGIPTAQDYLRHAVTSLCGAQIVQPLPDVC